MTTVLLVTTAKNSKGGLSIERESQLIAFIERIAARDPGAHLTRLLKKSVRAVRAKAAA